MVQGVVPVGRALVLETEALAPADPEVELGLRAVRVGRLYVARVSPQMFFASCEANAPNTRDKVAGYVRAIENVSWMTVRWVNGTPWGYEAGLFGGVRRPGLGRVRGLG